MVTWGFTAWFPKPSRLEAAESEAMLFSLEVRKKDQNISCGEFLANENSTFFGGVKTKHYIVRFFYDGSMGLTNGIFTYIFMVDFYGNFMVNIKSSFHGFTVMRFVRLRSARCPSDSWISSTAFIHGSWMYPLRIHGTIVYLEYLDEWLIFMVFM